MSRFLIIGAGAVGGLLAAGWARAGVRHTLIARGAAYEAISRDGLRIRRPDGDTVVRVDVAGSLQQAEPRRGDTIVLAVKSQDVEAALADAAWTPLVGGRGVVADLPVLTLQNGTAAEEIALRRFPTVIGVSVGVPASHLQPGVVICRSTSIVGVMAIGGYPASLPAEEETYRAALAEADFATWIEPDIAAAKRRKLLANLRNVIEVFDADDAQARAAEAALADEARSVFAAAGLPVAPVAPQPPIHIGAVAGVSAGLSTWQSFQRGASSEVDYLSGEIAVVARRAGVPAPLNAAVARALGQLAHRAGRPGEIPLPRVFATTPAGRML